MSCSKLKKKFPKKFFEHNRQNLKTRIEIHIFIKISLVSNFNFKFFFQVSVHSVRSPIQFQRAPDDPAVIDIADSTVLFRVYGKNSAKFYDPAEELKHFKLLAKYRIAPRLIVHGDGWRIEEWHDAVAVPVQKMTNPAIFTQVASQLGRFHKLHNRPDFPSDISKENLFIGLDVYF